MKRWLLLILSLLAAISFSACAESGNGREDGNDPFDGTFENDAQNPTDGDDGDYVFEDDALPDEGDDAPSSYEVREMKVYKGDAEIYGKLYLPAEHGDALPAVILSHSAYLTADSMNAYAIGFANRGYAAYAFDFCGGSSNSRSDGDTRDMTIFTETEDLKCVLAAIRELDFIDENNVYLFGSSQGGLVSALVADELPEKIRGMILLYPAFNIAELAQNVSSFGSLFQSYLNTGEAFLATLQDFDVFAHLADYTGKVLILHGSGDVIVPLSYSQRAAELYADCTLQIIQGANHGFNSENMSLFGNYDEEVWAAIDQTFGMAQ